MSDTLFEDPTSSAVLSDCGLYRYRLTRTWGPGPRRALFIMCNPSTADAHTDDRTIRRCIGFARTNGCDGLEVVNLYALRSTDPDGLWIVDDPVGPDNDTHLRHALTTAVATSAPVIAAWGVNPRPDRVAAARALPGMDTCHVLGLTKAGAPRHPLYVRADTPLMAFPSAIA